MCMIKKLLISCILLPVVANAKVPDTGFYADLGSGVSSINYLSTTASSWMVRLDGGYNMNKYVGFQVGANNFFSTQMTNPLLGNYNLSGQGYDVSIIPNIPFGVNAPLNVFARIGLGYDTMSASVGNQSATVDVLGLGLRYDISAHLTVSAQWIGRGLIIQPTPSNYNQSNFLANIGLYF